MLLVVFGFTGISRKHGRLFGEYREHPIITFRFLLMTIVWLKGEQSSRLFTQAIRGLCEDPDWLRENARASRITRKKIKSRLECEYERYKANFHERIERDRRRIDQLSDEWLEFQNEVLALRRVIKGLQRDKE